MVIMEARNRCEGSISGIHQNFNCGGLENSGVVALVRAYLLSYSPSNAKEKGDGGLEANISPALEKENCDQSSIILRRPIGHLDLLSSFGRHEMHHSKPNRPPDQDPLFWIREPIRFRISRALGASCKFQR